MMRVAFIGLGVMGMPMAGHLQQSGHSVCVFNRTTAKAKLWLEKFAGEMATSPAQAARACDAVFVCVGNDDDVREVVLGEAGAIAGMPEGALLIDHTTASADLARELNTACSRRGIGFIDAPVSGGQTGAETGQLSIMAGGTKNDFRRAEPYFKSYAKTSTLIGPTGAGQLCKMVNQLCIAGLVQGLAEGLHFAQQAQLDTDKVLSVISKGAAQSWQMENRSSTMLRDHYDHGFAVDWMRKDLAIVLAEARRNGSSLPVAALVDQFYSEIQAMGGGRWDTSSLLKRLQRSSLQS
jgi:3-hydroxyisobutyrate dehydrogenase-like beta-hydroxyacid dehydrogenase